MPMASLAGTLQPFIDFIVVNGCNNCGTVGVQAVAYVDTSDGSALPTPWPTIIWGAVETYGTGNALPTEAPTTLPTPNPSATPGQFPVSTEMVDIPQAAGQWSVTIDALGFPEVDLRVSSYNGFGISNQAPCTEQPDASCMNTVGFASGIQFDANGIAQNVDPTSADIYIDANGDVICPGGLADEGRVNLSQITAQAVTTFAAGTTISASQVRGSPVDAYECRINGSRVAKVALGGSSFGTPQNPNTEIVTLGYQVATNGIFAY